MKDIILFVSFVLVVFFGYLIMKRLDVFLSHYHSDITEEKRGGKKKKERKYVNKR